MGICQEVETQRERKGSRTLPGWQGFVLSCSRAMCWGCRSLQPAALGSSLRTWTAPGKTSEGNMGHREVNSRARNLPLASKKEARRPHTQPCSLLSWEAPIPMAKRGNSSPKISSLLSRGAGSGTVPKAYGLHSSLMTQIQSKSSSASSSPPLLDTSRVIVTVCGFDLIKKGWNILV